MSATLDFLGGRRPAGAEEARPGWLMTGAAAVLLVLSILLRRDRTESAG